MRVSRDRDTIQGYSTDESGVFNSREGSVEAVYYPECEEDIVKIIKEANETGTSLTISGGGTSITGSRVPMHGGAVISMERMLQTHPYQGLEEMVYKGLAGKIIFYLDKEKQVAHLPPGMLLKELAGALPPTLFYPPDPTETTAAIGGTVATNASGARSFKYGPTRDWIDGLRIVLANGEVLSIKRGETYSDQGGHFKLTTESGAELYFTIPEIPIPNVKNAAGIFSTPGMDLIDLFIGSNWNPNLPIPSWTWHSSETQTRHWLISTGSGT
jgi:D-lactate dehydrogenase (cytochrome)